MKIVGFVLLVALGVSCSDEPPAQKNDAAKDAPALDLQSDAPRDGGTQETSTDAPLPDLGPDGPPPLPCNTHHDCLQGSYCYYKKCVTDPDYPVYHCNKKDSSGTDTCPPGHKCVDKAGKISICAESSTYTCKDACDCGPAHCCKDVSGTKRCVKDTNDPWLPGGTATGGATCVQGTEATYCHTDPTCHEGRQAHADPKYQGKFRAFNRKTNSTTTLCGGKRCFGSAINCKTGESCIDTQQATPLPGKACLLLSGGTCVSNALAESVFGYKPADLLPKCSSTCPKGKPCDAGWVSDRKWAYKRIVGTCGSCGNGTCDAGEWSNNCSTDCLCGNTICGASEVFSCFQDCRACGNSVCEPGETRADTFWDLKGIGACPDCTCGNGTCDEGETVAENAAFYGPCPTDCTCGDGVCAPDEDCAQDCVCRDSNLYSEKGRVCGDGKCDRDGCEDVETCLSCPADCYACAWELVERSGGTALPPVRFVASAWGDLTAGITITGYSDLYLGMVLQFDGAWSSHALPGPVDLEGIWGSSANNLFATNYYRGVYRYNGEVWRMMTMPVTGTPGGRCERVWGRTANDVFATCTNKIESGVLRYDGNAQLQWTILAKTTKIGMDIWGPPAPSDELYLATTKGIERCKVSSKTCSPMKLSGSTNDPSFIAISGSQTGSKVDVFAVEHHINGPAVWHYDGNAAQTWTKMTLPSLPTSPLVPVQLKDVISRSANEAFVVGTSGIILRYDGKVWSKMKPPIPGHFEALFGDAADVFTLEKQTGAILRYDDKKQIWTWFNGPEGVSTRRFVQSVGVWGASSSDVFSIWGSQVFHHDGKAFKAMSLPTIAPLYGISGGSASDVMAVGGAGSGQAATVLRYDGATWSGQAAPSSGPLLGVTRVGKSYYAVGADGGKVWRFDGSTWSVVSTVQQTKWLSGIARCSATKLAVAGASTMTGGLGGIVAVVDTAAKSYKAAIITGVTRLQGVWCDAGGTVVAVGAHVDSPANKMPFPATTPKIVTCAETGGLTCTVSNTPQGTRYRSQDEKAGLHDIWGPSKNELYAVGFDGALLHYNGAKWEHLKADIRAAGHNWGCEDLLGIWGSKSDLFVSTRSGALRLGKLP